ncbi:branched-chain amino acid ABC transporter permease [Brucella anthropi]|jgi:branched-chain amino acid transport system permease protein|uniref:branched-chain amino acid ABC transporter permease n=1 Tax=Brucella anthropi TaxID=529 RepID=UPI000E98DE17|nr:branched-chain amino acid ABC transporter permease [Brucella anthropi]QOD67105.1 branched-chain amino acid ABC transporter permease [Ochrobactrum sp. MT180101]HBQ31850.1 branched-chain amino acid ABC transporter permease [Brucella anthropi]
MLLLQLIIDGIQSGAIYALMAVGFAIIFGTTRAFHYSHGAAFLIAGYAFYFSVTVLELNWFLSLLVALVLATAFGAGCQLAVYRPIQRDAGSFFTMFVASFGVAVVVENLVAMYFGSGFLSITSPFSRADQYFGLYISKLGLTIIVVAPAIFLLLNAFFERTRVGLALRGLADNPELIAVFGLSSRRLCLIALMLGSALIVPAAVFQTMTAGLTPSAGHRVMLISLAATIIGGIGSPRGAGMGGLLLGIAESLSFWKLPTGWSDAVTFLILLAFILLKPAGLLGRRARV